MARVATILTTIPLLWLFGCSPSPPNVLWIVVDSLRADHLGCYGHRADVSPAIDALAGDGVVFESAYATAPWTIPSVVSMLTGLHPTRHGVTRLGRVLPESLETLPEILQRRGYRTGAVVSHHMIGSRTRIDRGFEIFDESEARGHRHLSSPGVTTRARDLVLAFVRERRPFFLFVHYFDPHYQYRDHPEQGDATRPMGSLTGDESIMTLRDRLSELTPEDVAFLTSRYDQEIRFTDAAIGNLLGTLDELGIADETFVIFTADHGEELLDREWLGHTRTLYQELVRVPLILRGPGIDAGERILEPVSLLSLAPSILDWIGIEDGGAQFQDRALASLSSGVGRPTSPVFAEVDFVDRGRGLKEAHKKAIIGSRFKLIRDDTTGAVELYDLRNDPEERVDLADQDPQRRERLLGMLERHLERAARRSLPEEERPIPMEELRELEALGYVELERSP